MMGDENPTKSTNIQEAEFLSSVIEMELEHRGNDLAGTKAVLMALGCTSQKAEATLGSYLCRRLESKTAAEPEPQGNQAPLADRLRKS